MSAAQVTLRGPILKLLLGNSQILRDIIELPDETYKVVTDALVLSETSLPGRDADVAFLQALMNKRHFADHYTRENKVDFDHPFSEEQVKTLFDYLLFPKDLRKTMITLLKKSGHMIEVRPRNVKHAYGSSTAAIKSKIYENYPEFNDDRKSSYNSGVSIGSHYNSNLGNLSNVYRKHGLDKKPWGKHEGKKGKSRKPHKSHKTHTRKIRSKSP